MNCEISQSLLDVPAEEIPAAARAQIQVHLETCAACRTAWHAQRLLGAALAAVPAPDFSEVAGQRLLARVFAFDTRRQQHTMVAAAAAAVLVAGLVTALTLTRYTQTPEYVFHNGTLILQSEQPTTVGVRFDSGSALANVRFTIDLPQGMQLAGQPGLRHVSWVGELRKGQNLLKLPVVAHAGTHGVLTAELSQNGGSRRFSLAVLASQPNPLAVRLWHGLTHQFDTGT
ncbi:MAG: hypothetical protein KGL13_03675 [Gammaproteobacteria bacterium]|nr:hypothetical protein [Gammaproteobacteria bacterium]MDE2345549.1 hypothetical protein [Gammaproteobacteria bacterium]